MKMINNTGQMVTKWQNCKLNPGLSDSKVDFQTTKPKVLRTSCAS